MSTELTLPVVQLPPRDIYFPNSVLNIHCTRQQAISLLCRFHSLSNSKSVHSSVGEFLTKTGAHEAEQNTVSRDAIKAFQRLKGAFNNPKETQTEEEWLIIACLPGVDNQKRLQGRVATVCRILSVKDEESIVKIRCHTLTRGQISAVGGSTKEEMTFKVQLKEPSIKISKDSLNRSNVIKLCEEIKKFVALYTAARFAKSNTKSREDILSRTFLLLSPLASVLYSQLTKDLSTLQIFDQLAKKFESSATKFSLETQLSNIDTFVDVFPFTLAQKDSLLETMDKNERISKFNELTEFGLNVFKELERISFVIDNWDDIDSKSEKTKIITTHLKSLKFLVDDFNSNSRALTQPPKQQRGTTSNPFSAPGNNRPNSASPVTGNDEDNDDLAKLSQFVSSIDNLNIPEEGKKMVRRDFKRLQKMSASNSEYHVLLSYLEVIQDLPWNYDPKDPSIVDLEKAKAQMDQDHYGLENIKERILEYLAILNLHQKLQQSSEKKISTTAKAPILLLTGPPGVGKTSLARSIATTLGRKFQRISLGGLKDESEIKGHRRTYVGALPGLLIQALRKCQTNNPVILLDEIDKVVGGGTSVNKVNGDPAAALLEVLDPEQNINFTDHYIGFPVDLSNVVFLCTSNDHYLLSPPLLDRMELLHINGYNYLEKVQIGKKFILPRQIERSGLPHDSIQLDDNVILKICTEYTRESGVRNLERTIGSICRGKAIEYSKLLDMNTSAGKLPKGYDPCVLQDQVAIYIGIPPHLREELKLEEELSNKSGVVNGLSYNSDGSGSKLIFEMVAIPSSNFSINMTGRLGEVLVESGKIAVSLVKTILNGSQLNESNEKALKLLNSREFHLHVPMGSISKDGPSAGITMTMCLMSLCLNRSVPSNIAMTGEITLRGLVLPIGGVMEKLLGAHLTQKIDKVILPRLNRKDIIEAYLKMNKEDTEKMLKQETGYLETGTKDIYEEPEKFIEKNFGIEICYVEELNDVFRHCWGDQVFLLNKKTKSDQLHL